MGRGIKGRYCFFERVRSHHTSTEMFMEYDQNGNMSIDSGRHMRRLLRSRWERTWPAHGLGKWEGPDGDKFRAADEGYVGRGERSEFLSHLLRNSRR